jgi:hypothetical protein
LETTHAPTFETNTQTRDCSVKADKTANSTTRHRISNVASVVSRRYYFDDTTTSRAQAHNSDTQPSLSAYSHPQTVAEAHSQTFAKPNKKTIKTNTQAEEPNVETKESDSQTDGVDDIKTCGADTQQA